MSLLLLLHVIVMALSMVAVSEAYSSPFETSHQNLPLRLRSHLSAFVPSASACRHRSSGTKNLPLLSLSRDDDENGGEDTGRSDEKRRMSDVRAVQNMFYSSSSSEDSSSAESTCPRFCADTGVFHNLSLWREKLGYTEVPGRSLIGFVKDPWYTNLFETILRSGNDNDMYFGQLRFDNDDVGVNVNAASLESAGSSQRPPPRPHETDMNAPLFGWKERMNNNDAVVIGTLMRINDHVRLDDGRLMLLIHAVERFVVLEPKRKLPYPLADVMILPDEEELMASENNLGSAVQQSLRFNRFEYDSSIRFPIERNGEDDDSIVSLKDVLFAAGGDALGSLLPFAPYSFQDGKVDIGPTVSKNTEGATEEGNLDTKSSYPDSSQLVENDVIREAASFVRERTTDITNMPHADAIEKDLWVLIDEYVQLRGVTNVFPKHLLSLLPKDIIWPENFALDKLASMYYGIALAGAQGNIGGDETFARVADRKDYPNQRRQKRLSYDCTALLGGPVNDHPLLNRTMRRRLLEIPSTRGRLWAARELFEAYNSQFRGN